MNYKNTFNGSYLVPFVEITSVLKFFKTVHRLNAIRRPKATCTDQETYVINI